MAAALILSVPRALAALVEPAFAPLGPGCVLAAIGAGDGEPARWRISLEPGGESVTGLADQAAAVLARLGSAPAPEGESPAAVALEGAPFVPIPELTPAVLSAWLAATVARGERVSVWPQDWARPAPEPVDTRTPAERSGAEEEAFESWTGGRGRGGLESYDPAYDGPRAGSRGGFEAYDPGERSVGGTRGGDAFDTVGDEESFTFDGGGDRGFSSPRVRSGGAPASDAASDPPTAAPTPVPRHLVGEMPERVKLGAETELMVTLALQPGRHGGGSGSAGLRSTLSLEDRDVRLVLQSPGFSPLNGTSTIVHVPAGMDSDPALFLLRAEKEGVCTVKVSAFVDGTFLGALTLETTIDPAQATGPVVDKRALLPPRQIAPGEVTLFLQFDEKEQVYRYQFFDGAITFRPTMTSGQLKRPRHACVEDVVAQCNLMARDSLKYSAEATRLALTGLGTRLWDELIPQELQKLLWERARDIKRLMIQSDGDPIPWELLYPKAPPGYPDEDRGFLVEQFPIARILSSVPPIAELRKGRPLFVCPAGSPDSAEDEVESLRKLLQGPDAEPVDELDELLGRLKNPDFDVLHFACHNQFEPENPTASHVLFQGKPFTPNLLEGTRGSLKQKLPLVFMNACRSDGQSASYTRLAGWADSFLNGGAGAFVGSLWEVRDTTAAKFAHHFYQALLEGQPLGEALHRAREAMSKVPGDPTWLAYTLYGDPAATLKEGSISHG